MDAAQENKCIFCQECFDNKEDLQIHFRKHGDPKFNQSVKNRPSNESQAAGERSNEEDVNCDVCSEVFPTISKAITHKHKVHPDHDAKYFCPWCGKLFTMKHLYNKHIESTHDSKEHSEERGFHCDYCEVDFFMPAAMVYHNKFFHRQDTELATIGHSKILKKFGEELLQIYYCPFCGEEYYNKVNLHKHMGDDHSDENQSPEDVMRCPLCEAIFYHLDAYELHLTFHSTEDLYAEESTKNYEITEFSLETVPPMLEKVEDEVQDDDQNNSDLIGIEELLQQAMNESQDNDNSNGELPERKHKKRKKHKKSKKSAITLDEFFNMNKDVFGEGIDVQGIEEVPSRVVAKQLQRKPKMPASARQVQSVELAKLKQHGIVVKRKPQNTKCIGMKPKNVPVIKSVNVSQTGSNIIPNVPIKQNVDNSNDLLTKLLNNTNCGLKIVKKPSAQNNTKTDEGPDVDGNLQIISKSDVIVDEGSESEKCKQISIGKPKEIRDDVANVEKQIFANERIVNQKLESETHLSLAENTQKDMVDTQNTNTLQNICPQVNLKPVSSPKSAPTNSCEDSVEQNHSSNLCDNTYNRLNKDTDSTSLKRETRSSEKSLDALKHLSHLITVKTLNQSKDPSQNNEKRKQDIPSESPKDLDKHIPGESINVCSSEKSLQHLYALKNLSKYITVKSSKVQEKSLEVPEQKPEYKHTDNVDLKNNANGNNNSNASEKTQRVQGLSTSISVKSFEDGFSPTNDDIENEDEILSKADIKDMIEKQNRGPLTALIKNIGHTIANKSPSITKEENFTNIRNSDATEEENKDSKHSPKTNFESTMKQPSKTLDALKNLSKNITIKSLNQIKPKFEIKLNEDEADYNKTGQDTVENKVENTTMNSPSNNRPLLNKNTDIKKHTPSTFISSKPTDVNLKEKQLQITDMNAASKLSIMKQLPNITSKKMDVSQIATQQSFSKSSFQSVQTQGSHIIKRNETKEQSQEDVEIFNIDDSDDEGVNIQNSNEPNMKLNIHTLQNSQKEDSNTGNKDVLKNLSRNITVKSSKKTLNNDFIITKPKYDNIDHEMTLSDNPLHKNIHQNLDTNLQNALKNLGSNISVKAPHRSYKEVSDEHDSDSNLSAKVKITELDVSEDENAKTQITKNVVVETPDHSDSDEDYDNVNLSAIAAQKRIDALKRQQPAFKSDNLSVNLNLKSVNKDITKQSLKENNQGNESEASLGNLATAKNSNEMSLVPIDQNLSDSPNDKQQSPTRPYRPGPKRFQQQMCSSAGQVSTVNREVTVQTVQTKTVIQEITTTVTKTIKTINQTFKQEVKNVTQNTSMVRPQTIQGIRPSTQQTRSLQGMHVRSPIVGSKIRSSNPRPSIVNQSIRPTKQLLPIRPSMNMVRPSTNIPRMPKKPAPAATTSTQFPTVGKPLKISPTAMVSSNKRSSEEPGPFSCFKKPKESLIPVSDISPLNNQGETAVHSSSSSHMVKSNFTCSSKTMKGNTVMSSSQTKSATSSSLEQKSKQSTMASSKFMKSSQAKQSTFEERSEVSAPKLSTLETIEKLQKQGLLVKKPRVEEQFTEHGEDSFDES